MFRCKRGMTGRPHNLERRNAVYYVRLWPPKKLADRIGVRELRRSLGTKDYALAKIRCKAAVQWFSETVEWLEGLVTANRGELEKAANAYFERLIAEVDQPRNFADGTYEDEISFQIEQSRAYIEQKDDNLREHKYGEGTCSAAHQMLSAVGLDFGALDASAQLTASNYAERAERQRMRYFLHSIERPIEAFVPDDHLFAPASPAPLVTPPSREVVEPAILRPDITLERGIKLYIDYQTKKGWQGSMKDESQRVLRPAATHPVRAWTTGVCGGKSETETQGAPAL